MSLCTVTEADGRLTVRLPERIDTVNSLAVQDEIEAARGAHPGLSVTLDGDALAYVSSSGLRIILSLIKADPGLRMTNVGGDVYDTLEMTGFTELLPVEKKYRCLDLEGCPEIARGAQGIIYRYNDDTIVKVFKSSVPVEQIREEREKARHAFVLGLPTAISYEVVKVGDRYGSVFELLDCASMSRQIAAEPDRMDEFVRIFAELLRQIHAIRSEGKNLPDAKDTVRKWLDGASPFLAKGEYARLVSMVMSIPDEPCLLHFDYHTNNIMMQNGEALLIDLDTLCHGHPIFELANVFVGFVGFGAVDPALSENFLRLPYEVTTAFWKKFLPLYLGSEDTDYLAKTERKIAVLGYLRLVRHFARRWDGKEEEGRERIQKALRLLLEQLEGTDNLTF